MSDQINNAEKEIEIRSESFQETLGYIPPWILRWGILAVAAIFLLLLVGSAIVKYPDSIHSTMTLNGSTPSVGIVAKTSGKIQKIFVKDNQCVSQGAFLAVVENPANMDDVLALKNFLMALKMDAISISSLPPRNLNIGTIQSSYSLLYLTLSEYFQFMEHNYFQKKIAFTKDRIRKNEIHYGNMLRQRNLIKEQLAISKKQFARDSTLNTKGVLANEDLEKNRLQNLQCCLSLEDIQMSLETLQMQMTQMQESLLDVEYQYVERKNTLESQLKSQVSQLLSEIQSWELNNVLAASIAGKVSFTKYWNENQNITGGEEVFNIVPTKNGTLIGKAQLPTARSGKVKVGQKVNIHFSSYPDNEFGTVRGIVSSISLVPSKIGANENYIVEIKLPNGLLTTYKKELPFLPGMEGQADIITDDLTLLERFLLPLKKVLSESV